jgi:hypothetical protein
MKSAVSSTFGLLVACLPSLAGAALFDRGNGLIFDSTLNVTWQQNANLGSTNTFGLPVQSNSTYTILADGSMNWPGARMWIDAMNAANYLGYSDWRLPKIDSTFGFNFNLSYDGSTDAGYNVINTRNELAYLFYGSLGNLGQFDIQGNPNPPHNLNAGPFTNLQQARYWTGTQLPLFLGPNQAFTFAIGSGLKDWDSKFSPFYSTFAWAVRDGDVTAVPEAPTLILLFAGLASGALYSKYRQVRAVA